MRFYDRCCKCFTLDFIHAEIVSPLIVIFVLFSIQSAIVFSMSKSDYHYLENPRGEKHRAWNFLMTKRQKSVNKLIKMNE